MLSLQTPLPPDIPPPPHPKPLFTPPQHPQKLPLALPAHLLQPRPLPLRPRRHPAPFRSDVKRLHRIDETPRRGERVRRREHVRERRARRAPPRGAVRRRRHVAVPRTRVVEVALDAVQQRVEVHALHLGAHVALRRLRVGVRGHHALHVPDQEVRAQQVPVEEVQARFQGGVEFQRGDLGGEVRVEWGWGGGVGGGGGVGQEWER